MKEILKNKALFMMASGAIIVILGMIFSLDNVYTCGFTIYLIGSMEKMFSQKDYKTEGT